MLVLAAIFVFFSLATAHFLEFGNMIAMLHTMASVVIISCGMAMVVMTGNLDISLGSIAFLSSSIGVLLMTRLGWNPVAAFSVTLLCGVAFGMLNGFIVVVLGINPLITTLGTMITLRGVGLELTNASVIPLPEGVRVLGNLAHRADLRRHPGDRWRSSSPCTCCTGARRSAARSTPSATARRWRRASGCRCGRLVFLDFVLAGLLASIGGIVACCRSARSAPISARAWSSLRSP